MEIKNSTIFCLSGLPAGLFCVGGVYGIRALVVFGIWDLRWVG
jgi:hypothetical protein